MIVLREAGKDSFEDNPDKGIFEMDLHRLELPPPFPVGPVNAYLLRGDPLTLVDTGPKTVEAQTALERGVAAAGARLKDIRRILLTHGHTDHAGNAAWVAQRSGAPVHVHEGDRAKVSGRRWVLEHVKTFLTQAGLADSVVESFFEQIQALRQYLDPLRPKDAGGYLRGAVPQDGRCQPDACPVGGHRSSGPSGRGETPSHRPKERPTAL